MKRMAVFALFAALGAATLGAPVRASERLPAPLAEGLDRQVAAFTASEAKMRRMEIIRRTMEQDRYQRGRGYGRYQGRPGYGRYDGPRRYYGGGRPGYYAPGPRAYGQGVHPGTGYPPGYYGR